MKPWRLPVLATILIVVATASFGFDFEVQIKGGVNFPFVSGAGFDEFLADWPGAESKLMVGFRHGYPPALVNLVGGVGLSFGLFDFLALQPEALYTMGGYSAGTDEYTMFVNFSSIEVPLLLKLRLATETGGSFQVYAGPDVQYIVTGSQLYFQDQDGEVDLYVEGDVVDDQRMIAGFAAGTQFVFPSGGFIEARYVLMYIPITSEVDISSITWETFDVAGYPSLSHSVQVMFGGAF